MHTEDVAIRGDSIKLGQFVKLANLAATGGEAKELISGGMVQVNGEVEVRRGRTLTEGDLVAIMDPTTGTALASSRVSTDTDDDYFDEATADDDFDPEKWRNL